MRESGLRDRTADCTAGKSWLCACVKVWTAQNSKYVNISKSNLCKHLLFSGLFFPFKSCKLMKELWEISVTVAVRSGSFTARNKLARELCFLILIIQENSLAIQTLYMHQHFNLKDTHETVQTSCCAKQKKYYISTDIFADGNCSLKGYPVGGHR